MGDFNPDSSTSGIKSTSPDNVLSGACDSKRAKIEKQANAEAGLALSAIPDRNVMGINPAAAQQVDNNAENLEGEFSYRRFLELGRALDELKDMLLTLKRLKGEDQVPVAFIDLTTDTEEINPTQTVTSQENQPTRVKAEHSNELVPIVVKSEMENPREPKKELETSDYDELVANTKIKEEPGTSGLQTPKEEPLN